MGKFTYDLFLDESGSFDSDDLNTSSSGFSLVGGLLCDPKYFTDKRALELLPEQVHCGELGYKKGYLSVLEQLKKAGCCFVIFENRERLNVVNGDITYLNILSEGVVQLLHYLRRVFPDDEVGLNITIAKRKNMTVGYGVIDQNEYLDRLEEKIYLAAHRDNLDFKAPNIIFKDARSFKKLEFADLICNTWFSRASKRKFTDDDRKRIEAVYDPQFVYSVFEDATVGNLKRLMSEGRYGEMMHEICALKKLTGVMDIRNKLIVQIAKGLPAEQDGWLSFMSLQIGQYNSRRLYREGIALALNYKNYFLIPMADNPKLASRVPFWVFDTDFYILTMYDHIGNVSKCSQYLRECRNNISSINHSWEHIDYYFKFRIRELNCLIGCFDFEAALEKAENLISILLNAKELFGMIETYDGTAMELRSELLGKVYGVQLEAYTNLLARDSDLFDKALEASDNAIAEFSESADLHRQYQYRCSMLLTAGKVEEALASLLKVFDLELGQKDAFYSFVEQAYGDNNKDVFAVWHYTNVMVAMLKADGKKANEMFAALSKNKAFTSDLPKTNMKGYPWNMVVWNMSRWYRQTAAVSTAERYYSWAMAITKEHPEQVTMYSFSIPMAADWILQRLKRGEITALLAEKDMRRVCNEFGKMDLPDTMRAVFVPAAEDKIDEKVLRRLSNAWLR